MADFHQKVAADREFCIILAARALPSVSSIRQKPIVGIERRNEKRGIVADLARGI
jgi:hypothetical protein